MCVQPTSGRRDGARWGGGEEHEPRLHTGSIGQRIVKHQEAVGRRPRRRWLAELKAEALAWWVSASSDQKLQSVMDSHLRGVLLRQIFRTIRQRARPQRRVNAVVEFRIGGRRDGGIDRYRLTLADGRCRTSRHDGPPPALTVEVGPVAFLRLVAGTASPEALLLAGKLKLRGGLLLALALPSMLRIPRRRPRRPAGKR